MIQDSPRRRLGLPAVIQDSPRRRLGQQGVTQAPPREEPAWEPAFEEPAGEPAFEEPAWEPAFEEPAWEDPDFEDVSIASVAAGSENWDRVLYTLTNGRTAFASKGPDVEIAPLIMKKSGHQAVVILVLHLGWLVIPTHVKGGSIIKQGESHVQQQYAWGNQGPVMSPSTSDITKQIGSIEEREDKRQMGMVLLVIQKQRKSRLKLHL